MILGDERDVKDILDEIRPTAAPACTDCKFADCFGPFCRCEITCKAPTLVTKLCPVPGEPGKFFTCYEIEFLDYTNSCSCSFALEALKGKAGKQ